jgi:glycerol uptake facilitator protein
MAIYLTAGISGAHLNPAVSIALCIFADFDKRKLPFYILAQVAAPFVAAWCTRCTATCSSISNKPTTWYAAQASLELASVFSTYPCTAVHGPGIPGGSGHHRHPDGRDHGPDRRQQRLAPRPAGALLIGLLIAVIGSAMGP